MPEALGDKVNIFQVLEVFQNGFPRIKCFCASRLFGKAVEAVFCFDIKSDG